MQLVTIYTQMWDGAKDEYCVTYFRIRRIKSETVKYCEGSRIFDGKSWPPAFAVAEYKEKLERKRFGSSWRLVR